MLPSLRDVSNMIDVRRENFSQPTAFVWQLIRSGPMLWKVGYFGSTATTVLVVINVITMLFHEA